MSDDEKVPKFLVVARAVAEWPDTTCCEVKISCYEKPTAEDINRCREGVKEMFESSILDADDKPLKADRVAVVILPYCANDEPEDEQPYRPDDDDIDDGWQD